MLAKGSTVQATIEFLVHAAGPEAVRTTLDALPAEQRARLAGVSARDEVPYADLVSLWQAADSLLAASDPGWMERQGAYAIEQLGPRLYGGLLLKSTPEEFLTQDVSLFQLYYRPGNMGAVDHSATHAVMRLVGFHPTDRFFCRRFTGAWHAVIRMTGGVESRVHHVRCANEGDAFCEWELRWQMPSHGAHARADTPAPALSISAT